MNQLSKYVDILSVAPFYLGYLWAADKFCKKFLGTSKRREFPVGKREKGSGCLPAGGACKIGRKFFCLFFILSGAVFPAHRKKDSGTIFHRLDDQADQ